MLSLGQTSLLLSDSDCIYPEFDLMACRSKVLETQGYTLLMIVDASYHFQGKNKFPHIKPQYTRPLPPL